MIAAPRRTVAELMSAPVVAVDELTGVKEVARLLSERGFNAVPVTTRLGRLVGVVTEDDLIVRQDPKVQHQAHFWSDPRRDERQRARGRVAREVMSHPPMTIAPDAPASDAAEVMHEHHLKSLPVVDEEGTLVGMITRRDLLKLLTRPDPDIAEDVVRRLREESVDMRAISVEVDRGIVTLTGWVGRAGEAAGLTRCAEAVDGVVAVRPWINAEELLELI